MSDPISGHVYVKNGARGASWYYRARLPREVRKKLGPAWTGKGRPPAGYFTRRTAEQALQAILTDARRGTLAGAVKTGRRSAMRQQSGCVTSSTTGSAARPRSLITGASFTTRSIPSSVISPSRPSRPSGSTPTALNSWRRDG